MTRTTEEQATECDCTIRETGLPVLFPRGYKYCPYCRKKLINIGFVDEVKQE